ncbi:MAG: hypothetical protein DRJ51_07840 [Thermoprotei archaeon]|nr:MAG: hypothetical protein DRJ51_07840 [Thermoprotei archaeon]
MRTIDLRKKGEGCTDHPVVRLSKLLSSIERGESVKIIVFKEDIPAKALQLFLKSRGFRVLDLKDREGEVEAQVLKP